MRHLCSGRALSRTTAHKEAMLRNMAVSLVEHEVIHTTLPKAKELRSVIEPLITRSKTDTQANRRLVFARTRSKAAVEKLFDVLGKRYEQRPGGYLRILHTGLRTGDKSPMALVELVDRPMVEETVAASDAETNAE